MPRTICRSCILILAILLGNSIAWAQTATPVPILTQRYDSARDGQNTSETLLTTSNVTDSTFGKLYWFPVDGYVYAQPLYVPNVTIPGKGTHNVLYIASQNDSLYAYDADSYAPPLWKVSFLGTNITPLAPSDVGNTQDINPKIGITGTPVIDNTTGTLYVVVNTKESGTLVYRLHAIDITTGGEKFGGPVVLTASVPGTAADGNGTTVTFNVQWENQRPGLLLLNGYLYIGFASHGDNSTWHGWVLAYNATTLAQTGVWNTSPNGKGNGIWGGGSGISADSEGNAYVSTGNGDYPNPLENLTGPAPAPSTTLDFGDSIVRLSLTNGVPTPTDYFTPYNQDSLDTTDQDLGSGGVLIPPDQGGTYPHILLEVGKQGNLYVVNRDQMTSDGSHYCNGCTSDPEIIQTVPGVGGLWSMPTYWNGNIFLWGTSNNLKAYSLTNGRMSTSPTSVSTQSSAFPGPMTVVSSNGTSNGIVWAAQTDGYPTNQPAVLRAWQATDVGNTLYDSSQTVGRDTLGAAVKFVVPVVTNGKVYVGTETEVDAFGLLSTEPTAAAPVMTPPPGNYTNVTPVSLSSTSPGAAIYYTLDGSMPTMASTLYTEPITVAANTTITAIAAEENYVRSSITTGVYTISGVTAAPILAPAGGSFDTPQSVQITDTDSTAVIYYTTDGSIPNHSSLVYNTAISVPVTTTINAIASAPGFSDSPVVSATYTIAPIDFSQGFSTLGCLQLNGNAINTDDSRLQLTDGGTDEAGSAFCTTLVDVRGFTTDFTFQLSNANADGMTFTIQNSAAGATALGPEGGGLGYGPDTPGGTGGIPNSVAIKFDLYNNAGEGTDSTGMYTDGASPTVPAIDLTNTGINLHSGDDMSVHLVYDGTTLTMTITDDVTLAFYSTSWTINIPATVGSNEAYVGFTGGTGGSTASQKIVAWTFESTGPQQWTFVTSSESAPNAIPQTQANGTPYSCSGQNPDNSGDATAGCYNPLVITADWTATPSPTTTGVSPALGDSITNSNCSASGNVTNMSVTGYQLSGTYSPVITVTLDNGATIVYTATGVTANNQITGTYTSTGACMNGDSGSFTATVFPVISAQYAGSFESSTGGANASVQMALKTDANFNVTGTITPATGAAVCFSNLTVGSTLASAYGPSLASGDLAEAIGSDSSGNVVAFVASNTDANANALASGGLYVTYIGLAGACKGISGSDVPFRKIQAAGAGKSLPRAPRHGPVLPRRFGNWLNAQRATRNQVIHTLGFGNLRILLR